MVRESHIIPAGVKDKAVPTRCLMESFLNLGRDFFLKYNHERNAAMILALNSNNMLLSCPTPVIYLPSSVTMRAGFGSCHGYCR